MIIELKEGLTFEIQEGALDDWALVELLADMEEDPLNLVKVAKMLLTPEDYEKLKEVNKEENGRVNATKVAEMLTNILLAGNATKK